MISVDDLRFGLRIYSDGISVPVDGIAFLSVLEGLVSETVSVSLESSIHSSRVSQDEEPTQRSASHAPLHAALFAAQEETVA